MAMVPFEPKARGSCQGKGIGYWELPSTIKGWCPLGSHRQASCSFGLQEKRNFFPEKGSLFWGPWFCTSRWTPALPSCVGKGRSVVHRAVAQAAAPQRRDGRQSKRTQTQQVCKRGEGACLHFLRDRGSRARSRK